MQMGVIDLDTRHAPGGKSLPHSYSLRIWLTKSSTKSGKILDENENQIGANVQAKIIKSRFGTENRICRFGLSWGGGRARIIEEDAWLEYCKKAGVVTVTGAWMNFDLGNGQDPIKFRQKEWTEILEKPGVMDRVLWA